MNNTKLQLSSKWGDGKTNGPLNSPKDPILTWKSAKPLLPNKVIFIGN